MQVIFNRVALQKDLDSLFKWSTLWQLNFNILKCKMLHFGPHQANVYNLNGTPIEIVTSHKDLGILFDDKLKFHLHSTDITSKANRILGIIKRSFEFLDSNMITRLFKSLVRPILEYGNCIWGPHFILDQTKIEKIQRRATRLIPSLSQMSYVDCLTSLSLPSLHYRRRRGDLITMYKIINNYFSTDLLHLFSFSNYHTTRGHQFKLFKHHSRLQCRSNFLSNRVINDWNDLPSSVVNAESLIEFKTLLDSFLSSCRFFYV